MVQTSKAANKPLITNKYLFQYTYQLSFISHNQGLSHNIVIPYVKLNV